MLISDLDYANTLAKQLQAIDSAVASASTVKILVNGKPIDDELLKRLHAVGDPVVAAYYASARAEIVAQLNSLGITES